MSDYLLDFLNGPLGWSTAEELESALRQADAKLRAAECILEIAQCAYESARASKDAQSRLAKDKVIAAEVFVVCAKTSLELAQTRLAHSRKQGTRPDPHCDVTVMPGCNAPTICTSRRTGDPYRRREGRTDDNED